MAEKRPGGPRNDPEAANPGGVVQADTTGALGGPPSVFPPHRPGGGPEIGIFIGQPGPQPDSLAKNIGPEQMSQLIDATKVQSRYDFVEAIVTRVLAVVVLLAGLVLLYLLCRLFLEKDQPDVLEKIIVGLLGFLSGTGLGFGVGKATSKKSPDGSS